MEVANIKIQAQSALGISLADQLKNIPQFSEITK